jgi:hypothetical protein
MEKVTRHRCANCHRRGAWSFSFLGLRQLRWLCPGCAPEPTGLDLAIAEMWPQWMAGPGLQLAGELKLGRLMSIRREGNGYHDNG